MLTAVCWPHLNDTTITSSIKWNNWAGWTSICVYMTIWHIYIYTIYTGPHIYPYVYQYTGPHKHQLLATIAGSETGDPGDHVTTVATQRPGTVFTWGEPLRWLGGWGFGARYPAVILWSIYLAETTGNSRCSAFFCCKKWDMMDKLTKIDPEKRQYFEWNLVIYKWQGLC